MELCAVPDPAGDFTVLQYRNWPQLARGRKKTRPPNMLRGT